MPTGSGVSAPYWGLLIYIDRVANRALSREGALSFVVFSFTLLMHMHSRDTNQKLTCTSNRNNKYGRQIRNKGHRDRSEYSVFEPPYTYPILWVLAHAYVNLSDRMYTQLYPRRLSPNPSNGTVMPQNYPWTNYRKLY